MTPHTGPRVALTALLWLSLLPASWAQMKFATSVDPRFARSMAELDGVTQSVILEPSVDMVLGHHFLNQKHAELIPRLTQVLRKMEADGSIKKIQASALREFKAQCG